MDRLMYVDGHGHMIGLPTRPGVSSVAVTGVPIDGITGFGTGAIFPNFKGGSGTAFYVNRGTNASATWFNLA